MKLTFPIYFLFLCLSFVACSGSKDRITNELLISNNDTLKQERSFSDPEIPLKKDWERSLGLTSLENGSQDFVMRIWEDIEFPFGRVVDIEHTNGTWNGEIIEYITQRSMSGEKIALPQPKSGWVKFLNELLDLDILMLPDYKMLPNYDVPSDEIFVTVEIAKKNYYRSYEYPNPYRHKNYETANKMVEILQLIKKEFSLQ